MNDSNILVVGDVMLDRNVQGNCNRLSPEGPFPVIEVDSNKIINSLGAAANVASHITSAEIKCILMGKRYIKQSNPNDYDEFDELCNEKEIIFEPLSLLGNGHLTTKERILAGKHQICRIDREDIEAPDKETECDWIVDIQNMINTHKVRCVILSDYNKGSLTDNMIQNIAYFCKGLDIPVILDPKRPSYFKLKHLTVVKPNAREVKITNLDISTLSDYLEDTYLINTMGPEGLKVFKYGRREIEIPTFAQENDVKDVTGCGDSMSAIIALSFLFYGDDIKKASIAANRAAYYCIQHYGTYVLTKKEITECFQFAEEYKIQ